MVGLSVVKDSSYFTQIEHDSKHGMEYFSEKDSIKGFWQGKLAEKEGLIGKEVNQKDIEKIKELSNSERVGLNVTYSASKSVSLAYSLLKDERIKEAHEKAVMKANEYLEQNIAYTRQGQGGKELVKASAVAIANFTHYTSREHDPQLHTHSVIMNSVERSTDGKITALEPKKIFENQKALDQIYKNELAKNLQELGYRIEMTDKNGNFEIVGFSQELLDKFSTRREQVIETAKQMKENGILHTENEYKLRDVAAIESRQQKEFLTKEELEKIWNEKLQELGITREQIKESIEHATVKELSEKKTMEAAKEYIRQAYNIIHENESAFTKEKLYEIALRQSLANAIKDEKVMTVSELEKAFNELVKEKKIIKLKDSELYTTKDMQKIEKEVIDFVKKTNGTEKELVSDKEKIDKAIQNYEKEKGFSMTQDQKNAVYHIATSKDKVIGIQGDAGVGKTTSLECIKPLLEQEGYRVRGLAPTGIASEQIQKANVASQTIDSFFNQAKNTQIVKDIDKYTEEYNELNQKFENKNWATFPSLSGSKHETIQSQINEFIRKNISHEKGFEFTDRAYVIEKDGWKGQLIIEQGNFLGMQKEINTYLRDMQTGKITHTRFSVVAEKAKVKEFTKEYNSPDKVIAKGKEVWVVDEASMISSKEMNELLKLAKEADARVVVSGDIKQLRAVEQGKIFEDMQKNGMNTLNMTEKVRQKEEQYKELTKAFSEKDFTKTIENLEKSGKVHEIQNKNERIEAIKQEYLKGDYKKTHIVTATNKTKNELNQAIREELKKQGKIDKQGYVYTVKESKNLSPEEKKYAFSYQKGDIVHISRQDMKEMGISSKTNDFKVKEVNTKENSITVTNGKKEYNINLQKHGEKLSVYSQKQIEISKGDKVMTLKNDKKLGINNGEQWIVKNIDAKGNITLKNDNKEKTFNIKDKYNYIDHSYASTIYKSQGMTVNKIIYDCSRKTNYNEMYTSLTRGKQEYSIYTNDKQEMYQSMQKMQDKTSTIEQSQLKESVQSQVQNQSISKGR